MKLNIYRMINLRTVEKNFRFKFLFAITNCLLSELNNQKLHTYYQNYCLSFVFTVKLHYKLYTIYIAFKSTYNTTD